MNHYNTDCNKLWVHHTPTENINAVNETDTYIFHTKTYNILNFSVLGIGSLYSIQL